MTWPSWPFYCMTHSELQYCNHFSIHHHLPPPDLSLDRPQDSPKLCPTGGQTSLHSFASQRGARGLANGLANGCSLKSRSNPISPNVFHHYTLCLQAAIGRAKNSDRMTNWHNSWRIMTDLRDVILSKVQPYIFFEHKKCTGFQTCTGPPTWDVVVGPLPVATGHQVRAPFLILADVVCMQTCENRNEMVSLVLQSPMKRAHPPKLSQTTPSFRSTHHATTMKSVPFPTGVCSSPTVDVLAACCSRDIQFRSCCGSTAALLHNSDLELAAMPLLENVWHVERRINWCGDDNDQHGPVEEIMISLVVNQSMYYVWAPVGKNWKKVFHCVGFF